MFARKFIANSWRYPRYFGTFTLDPYTNVFQNRRQRLMDKLCTSIFAPSENNVVVVPGYRMRYQSKAVHYPFHQNTEFFYLTGIQSQDSVLVMSRDAKSSHKSMIFTETERDSSKARWDGPTRYTKEHLHTYMGFDNVYQVDELESVLNELHRDGGNIGISSNPPSNHGNSSSQHVFWPSCLNVVQMTLMPEQQREIVRCIHFMRLVKESHEQAAMRESCAIAANAMKTIMIEVGSRHLTSEHQVASRFEYLCKMSGAWGNSYVPVVACGESACTIHYTDNNKSLNSNDLLLVDAGTRFGNYCSDITRTFPVSGKFQPAQARLYNALLDVQEELIINCTEKHEIRLGELLEMSRHLITTKICTQVFGIDDVRDAEQVASFIFPHHIGHWLGLDVHDCGTVRDAKLLQGMCVTVEPAVYIPSTCDNQVLKLIPGEYHGIGMRIEDDILVQRDYAEVMTKDVPKSIVEIEALMSPT